MSIFMRLIIGIGMLLIKQNIEGCIFELLSSSAERRQPCLDYCRYRRIKDDKIARWMNSHRPMTPYDNATPVLNLSSSARRFLNGPASPTLPFLTRCRSPVSWTENKTQMSRGSWLNLSVSRRGRLPGTTAAPALPLHSFRCLINHVPDGRIISI